MLQPEPSQNTGEPTVHGTAKVTGEKDGNGTFSSAIGGGVISAPAPPVVSAPSTATTGTRPHPIPKYKMHWHVLLTHFPISFFLVSSLFMLLHFVATIPCFEPAAAIALLAGATMMVPSTITGWNTWKNKYRGHKLKLFQYKIYTAFAMIGISFSLLVWRGVAGGLSQAMVQYDHPLWHVGLLVGTALLIMGAVVEGYYGGKLNHR